MDIIRNNSQASDVTDPIYRSEITGLYELATLYDEQHRTFTEDIPMHQALARSYGSPVLELGAGTSRVGLSLAADGHEVWGLDMSPEMVGLSAEKARDLSLTHHAIVGDMRNFDLTKDCPSGFGLIIMPFNTICHLIEEADLFLCLNCIKRHLKPGGVFAPSFFVPDPVFLYRDTEAVHEIDRFWSESKAQYVDVYERNRYDRLLQINHVEWFFSGDKDDEMLFRRFRLRVYYPRELRYLLSSAGFTVMEEWEDYKSRPLGRDAESVNSGRSPIVQTPVFGVAGT